MKYSRVELEDIVRNRSGIDFGTLLDLVALERGPSGRISRLLIKGTKQSLSVGKELEIRKWLSPTHLLSSAFIVSREMRGDGLPEAFTLHGAGWGHGVGMCQIGAAVMSTLGMSSQKILKHYFRGAKLEKLY